MKVTRVEVVIPLKGHPELLAYIAVEFDQCFIVHSMRLINGTNGWFVAMPSKKTTDRCPGCEANNAFDAKFCDHCGNERMNRPMLFGEPQERKHQDIVHPLTREFR